MLLLKDEVIDLGFRLDQAILKRRQEQTLDTLVEDLKGILTNSWKKSTRQALITILNKLSTIEGPASMDELLLIENHVAKILGMPIEEARHKQLINIQQAAYSMGIKEGAHKSGVKIAWNLADQKSLDVLDENLMYWIGSYYNDNISEAFKATLQDFFEGGYNRNDLAKLMRQHFKGLASRPDSYWDLLADHTATKTREIGRVSGYEKAGIEVVRVKARLDSRTTEVCRRLHGQIISVEDLRRQVNGYLAACGTQDKEKIKASWPWISDAQATRLLSSPQDIERRVKGGKIGLPPYHARCRTITVAEFFADAGDKVVSDQDQELGAIGDNFRAPRRRKEWHFSEGTQAGSNKGGLVLSPNGKQYYAKFYWDPDQARHEVLANKIFEKLGIGAPKSLTDQIKINGKKEFAYLSEWIEGAQQLGTPGRKFTKAEQKQLTKQWLGAVLNGNRDMVGATYDNLVKKGRRWYVIDQGGSFHFRAQGGIKNYTADIVEWETTLSPGRKVGNLMNPILHQTIKQDPSEYIKWLKGLTDKKIKNAVIAAGLEDSGIASTIIARRDSILQKLESLRPSKPNETYPGARRIRDHLGKKLPVSETVSLIKEDCKAVGINIDDNVAREVARNLRGYTGSWYRDMRHAQLGRTNNPDMLQRATMVEEYLDVAAKFPGNKLLYRGMKLKRNFFNEMDIGDDFELKAMASFSTAESKAMNFAGTRHDGAMLVLHGATDHGTTVQHLSNYFSENEVLVSGRNVLRIIRKEEKNGYLYVHAQVERYTDLERQVIKVLLMTISDEEILNAGATDMTREEMVRWKADADKDVPLAFISNKTGKQYLVYPDGRKEEIGPDHHQYVQLEGN